MDKNINEQMDLEKQLNKLIEKGYGKEKGYIICKLYKNGDICFGKMEEVFYSEPKVFVLIDTYSLNDLCSIDSGLWQFCVKEIFKEDESDFYAEIGVKGVSVDCQIGTENYRLMLSSIQEDKAQFILDNIKLD